ncbi:hypothetical protein [Actinoplanes siamensis]|uniref:Uncharacterized protein n=1 Tax=Actinoplanes siamensis TaxID=1223317 RepID=A0A919N2Z0_9ACTN|nr:hypothetical protein [Actinoplanes siamensis]GIF02638.1 hypothetical protein Asi03nite_01760 [Actinoplanes siamensis]
MRKTKTAWRRTAAAYATLRGRPPRPDYGILIVLPLLAAAGGALIALGMEILVTRQLPSETVVMTPAGGAGRDTANRRLEPVGS